MALVIYWYDFICFAIIATSTFISFMVIWLKEGTGRYVEESMHENLLDSESDGCVGVTRSGLVSSTQLWTSCWRGLHPTWLMGLRLVSAVVMAGILAWDIQRYDTTIFLYYTEWTFSLTIFYFVLATIISASGLLGNSETPTSGHQRSNEFMRNDLEESKSTSSINFRRFQAKDIIKLQSIQEAEQNNVLRAGFWGSLMQIVYQTCAGAVVLTDAVFWFIIVPFLSIRHFCLSKLMVCMHTLNALFLLVETALNSLVMLQSFPSFRLVYFVLWSCLYVIVQWVLHACGFSWLAHKKFQCAALLNKVFPYIVNFYTSLGGHTLSLSLTPHGHLYGKIQTLCHRFRRKE
ncbi:hypothetical protein IFM89_020936 [Coptis chinensis]|uniref:Transmembrane protein n=1 Tax=Coptis chinensis TaxID=261450 RepID=A0A835MBY7_9MAGN|nr:hypothetical protein IFM89_020936 [Coptis chinensis]